MSAKEIVLTYEGLKKLEEELEYLRGTKRKEVAERIKQALSFGDISENSEYDKRKMSRLRLKVELFSLKQCLKMLA